MAERFERLARRTLAAAACFAAVGFGAAFGLACVLRFQLAPPIDFAHRIGVSLSP